jgi:hypothetical protein
MKIKELEYNHSQLDCFGPNDVYRKCHKELLADFETTFSEFLEQEIPDDTLPEVKQSITSQKTGLLVAWVSGHLNAFNPKSEFFVKFETLSIGNKKKENKSGLILPDHLR